MGRTAMFYIKERAMTSAKTAATLAILGLGLSGCVESRQHLSDDFGAAIQQDLAAQVADPDARYKAVVAPGSDGGRVALAQQRYREGKVIEPVAAASKIGAETAAAPTSP